MKNPAAALDFAVSLPDEFRKYPLIAAATAWAKTEPLAALEWSLENGVKLAESFRADGSTMSQTVLRSAFEVQPEETLNWLIDLPASPERQQYIKSALQDQLWKPSAATDLLTQTSSPARRLFNALLPHEKERMATQLGATLAGKGAFPDESQWKALFPDEGVRMRAMAGALGAISHQSASRGEALVAQIPEGPARDFALREVTFAQSYATPELAVQHALQIRSQDIQYSALDRAISSWLRRDESACRVWLDSAKELPAEWVADWLAEAQAQ
ncbi:MAG: hypothetical protein EOP84_35705 [Verrucomicrobiaceae bacterium]|nr:MAG: hypothetical protein EOP84_35705 [Verrucomicrobiaceae bacterium]